MQPHSTGETAASFMNRFNPAGCSIDRTEYPIIPIPLRWPHKRDVECFYWFDTSPQSPIWNLKASGDFDVLFVRLAWGIIPFDKAVNGIGIHNAKRVWSNFCQHIDDKLPYNRVSGWSPSASGRLENVNEIMVPLAAWPYARASTSTTKSGGPSNN